METTFEEIEGVLKVGLSGRFVAATAPEVRDLVMQRMDRFTQIVFDLSKMTHIDSSGLGILVQVLQHAQTRGGTVKLACLQPHPQVIFDITKVHRVFSIYSTVEEALASFS